MRAAVTRTRQSATIPFADTLAGQPIAIEVEGDPDEQNNGLFYIHSDHLGSVNALTNENGNLHLQTTFYPFGDYRNSTGHTITDRGFTNHRHNDDLGLIYMNARYYLPYNELVKLAGDTGRVIPFSVGSVLVVASAGLEGGTAEHTPVRIVYDMGAAFAFDIVVDSVAGMAAVGAGALGSAAYSPAVGVPVGGAAYVAVQYAAREPVNQATEALWVSLTMPIPQTQVIPPSPVPTPPPPVNFGTPAPW